MDTPLARPISDLKDSYGVVVVGSGYGGSIVAARLAQGRSLCLLERGREWIPGAFPDEQQQVERLLRLLRGAILVQGSHAASERELRPGGEPFSGAGNPRRQENA